MREAKIPDQHLTIKPAGLTYQIWLLLRAKEEFQRGETAASP